MVDFYFTSDFHSSKKLVEFLAGDRLWIPRTDYPDFMYWLDKVEVELESGQKQSIVAFYQKKLVGAILFQKHKQIPSVLELKNLTVLQEAGGRFVASFLIRNAEVEGLKTMQCLSVMGDAKRTNHAITDLMLKNGYNIVSDLDLYHLGRDRDNLFFKEVKSGSCDSR